MGYSVSSPFNLMFPLNLYVAFIKFSNIYVMTFSRSN